MIKTLLFLIVLVGLCVGALHLVSLAPYHIYTLTLTEGVNTKFLKMDASRKELLDGNTIDLVSTKEVDASENLFTQFHFSNFIIPLPVDHVLYSMIPAMKIEDQKLKLGAYFLDAKNRDLFSFLSERVLPLNLTTNEQKIFTLPFFSKYIATKSLDEIWMDLFSKKLSLPATTGKSFYDSLDVLKKITYSDLVYNLYILYNRHLLIPPNIKALSFDPKTNMGLIELPSNDPHEKIEQAFFINNGLIYKITIKTKILYPSARSFRAKFLKELQFKVSHPDSAISIYAQYKNLSYKNRIEQKGMTFLYSAWSHDLENRDFVRVIILFLERGKENLKFLQPFYEYAYKKFGTNLSSNNELLDETANERLKRKMKEELENETKNLANEKTVNFEGNFATQEEKINFLLRKAKDKKKNSDDKNKALIIE